MIRLWLILALFLVGCDERFRYPCQDPKNWETSECKRPQCAVTGTCPDQLTKPEERRSDDR
jgi:hypothetical protein